MKAGSSQERTSACFREIKFGKQLCAVASDLVSEVPPDSHAQRVLKNIRSEFYAAQTEACKRRLKGHIESIQDHLAVLRVGVGIFRSAAPRFEEMCSSHQGNVRHDTVIDPSGIRIVIEVRRLREENLGGDKFQECVSSRPRAWNRSHDHNPAGLIEREEWRKSEARAIKCSVENQLDSCAGHGACRCATLRPSSPSDYRAGSAGGRRGPGSASPVAKRWLFDRAAIKTSPLAELLKIINSEKRRQVCRGSFNILWFVSWNPFFGAIDVEDAAVEVSRSQASQWDAVGWLRDRVSVPDAQPSCRLLRPAPAVEQLLSRLGVRVRTLPVHGSDD